jgi:phage gpG-like protein
MSSKNNAADFFRRLQRSLPKLKRDLGQMVIAVEAENFHAENFRKEGFTDTSFQPWPKRKKQEPGGRRALLVKTGALKGHALKGRVRNGAVDFVFPMEYMKVHNEGGRAGRGRGFKMPKRQFVGKSAELERRIERKGRQLITHHLNRI